MRRIVTVLLLVVSLGMDAQTYDEAQLTGGWEPQSVEGTLPHGILSIEQVCLGDTVRYLKDSDLDGIPCSGLINMYMKNNPNEVLERNVPDFFITNNDKLHIIVGDDYSLRFKIVELTDRTLELKSYDGKCCIMLEKAGTTRVSEVKQKKSNFTAIYNLSGQRIGENSRNGLYIVDGMKKQIMRQ